MKVHKKNVLFICTHNSCRSQIAEGFLNTMYKDKYQAFSAGIKKTNVNPYVIEVMKELGIDLSKHYSKKIEDLEEKNFDFVVTVCDKAHESCPFFSGKKVVHKNFEDPANFEGSLEDTLVEFRKVRDEIKNWIVQYFG
jgi:arsenate reductase